MGLRNAADHTLILCRELASEFNAPNNNSTSCQDFSSSLLTIDYNPALAVIKDGTQSILLLGIQDYANSHQLRLFYSLDQGQTFTENTNIQADGGDQTSTAPFFVTFNGLVYISGSEATTPNPARPLSHESLRVTTYLSVRPMPIL